MNFLVFNRASKTEYDAWEEFGNQGWGWDGLLDSFKASTNYTPDAHSKEKVHSHGSGSSHPDS